MTQNNVKVAVIGAGNWGRNHVRTFHALSALGAICEIDAARRAHLTAEYPDIPLFSDYREVWSSRIPAVVIATPAATHYELAKAALLAGKDVFVEKPMTLAAGEAENLVALAAQKGRVLMVGHLLIYQPALRFIEDFLRAERLGTIHSFHQERLNLGRARSVENALWSLGVHDVAVLLRLAGDTPERVQANGQCVLQSSIEDDVHVHMCFPGGVQAHLHVSWLWPEKKRRLTVIGSVGMLVYDEIAGSVVLHRKRIAADLTNCDEGCEVVFAGHEEPLRIECQHFLDCVAQRKAPLSDGQSGLAVVRVMERASQLLEEQRHE